MAQNEMNQAMQDNLNNMSQGDFENLSKMMNKDGGIDPGAAKKSMQITPEAIKNYDIYKVDYDFVEQCTDKRELKLAVAALKADGYFD